ncbi:aminotransferase class V-fold PLP-dependent enzyme [Ignavibacterium album]|uniref:aminotransferase class V-fold PLP-dependent enzyme n=1 Tax=Ignavibacterium album TaxID=591197 RepID=UPI0026ED55CE|nr:aminotransferase class V-fold PLP-dependent enzyme [Ignavibacterium album]
MINQLISSAENKIKLAENKNLLDVSAIRRHFLFPERGRIVTNNAASTQPPKELLNLYTDLSKDYENVHRGQSNASRYITNLFEESYNIITKFINAPDRRNIVITRNTTEAINTVMYSLLTQFRDGDNIVTTFMEHNSNYVPWYGLCKEILPKFGIKVECRLARFQPQTGELDLTHLKSLVDSRTKIICCIGASNFLGTKIHLHLVKEIADYSGYLQPNGECRSLLLVDGAQLIPGTFTDFHTLNVDYLCFSFHKMLAPFGIGVLCAKQHLLETSLPFLYGGDMIAEGDVSPDYVGYNSLPWKYAAGTPNILGTIISAQALRLLLDLALNPDEQKYFLTTNEFNIQTVEGAMNRISSHIKMLTEKAMYILSRIKGITIYGPKNVNRRTGLISFNVAGCNPFEIAEELNKAGVESRAGCHCATLAHKYLKLDPPASCRLSFYFYNTIDEAEFAAETVNKIVNSKNRIDISLNTNENTLNNGLTK